MSFESVPKFRARHFRAGQPAFLRRIPLKRMFAIYLSSSLLKRIFLFFVIGAAIGLWAWHFDSTSGALPGGVTTLLEDYFGPFGDVLVRMLKAVVIPLVFFTLVAGAASLPLKRFGSIGGRIFAWYMATSLIAAILGTILALAMNPGTGGLASVGGVSQDSEMVAGSAAKASAATGAASIKSIILGLFENPFGALSRGDFLPVVVFAILAGLALRFVIDEEGGSGEDPLLAVIGRIIKTLFKMVDWIMEYSPIGILCLTAVNFAKFGPMLAGPYMKIAGGVIAGIGIMIVFVYSGIVWVMTKRTPLSFFRVAQQAMITAFVTRSSGATLPVSMMTAIDGFGVKKEVAEFSLPLGATVNMDGVCIHLPMFAILAANLYGVHLGFGDLVTLVLTTVLAAIGAGGVPGGSVMLLFLILGSMGLNDPQIASVVAFAMGINPVLDMFETMNNVTGDIMCTYVVAHSEGLIEERP